jgi:phage recombination protein Bet
MNTQIQVRNSQIDLIKNTVAKNATDEELQLFMHVANKYELDPLNKEIWFIKYNDKAIPSMFTSRDGYLKIAHRSGVFDGMNSYTIDDEHGNPIKGVCEVYRKDMRHSFKAEVKVSEYKQNSPTWSKFTSAMIIKVAEVFALKRAFSISGLVTQEEITVIEPIETIEDNKYISEAQRKRLFAIAKSKNVNNDKIKEILLNEYGISSSKEIPVDKYNEIIEIIEIMENTKDE